MAVNRFEKPAQQQLMDTYVPLPYKELLLAGKAQQGQLDELDANRLALGDKEFYNLGPDSEKAREAREWLDQKTGEIADYYGTDMGKAKSAYRNLEREVKKRFGQSGDIGAMNTAYETRATYSKAQKDRLAKGDITSDQYEKSMAAFDRAYAEQKGIGEGGIDGYQGYGTEEIAKYVDYSDFANKYGKDIKSDIIAHASSKVGGDGYIRDFDSALETMSPEEVNAIVSQYAQGSDELMNYLRQGTKYGYSSLDALTSAIGGATKKYSFDKETKSASTATDATYRWAVDKAEEKAANEALHLSGATPFVDLADSDESFQMAANNNRAALDNASNKIEALQTEMQGYTTTDENGNVVVDPKYVTNYNAAEKQLELAQREFEQADGTRLLNEETLLEAVAEVSNRSDLSGKVIRSADENFIQVEDPTKIVSFFDEAGNRVSMNEFDSYIDFADPTDQNVIDFMAANNLTPGFETETIDYRDNKNEVNKVLNSRKAKSEDFVVDYYTATDFELSPQLEAVQEDILNNLEEGFDIMVTDENNRLVKASDKISEKYHTYADMSRLNALTKLKKDEELSDTDKKVIASMLDVVAQREGREAFQEETKLVGTTKGNDGYAIFTDPNGQKFAVKPKNSYKQSFNDMMEVADRQIYTTTGDEKFKMRAMMRNFSGQYNELKSLKKDLGDQKVMEPGVLLNKKPVPLVGGYYLHVGRAGNPGTVHTWISTDNTRKEYPSESDSKSMEVSIEELDQVGMNQIEAILLAARQ